MKVRVRCSSIEIAGGDIATENMTIEVAKDSWMKNLKFPAYLSAVELFSAIFVSVRTANA